MGRPLCGERSIARAARSPSRSQHVAAKEPAATMTSDTASNVPAAFRAMQSASYGTFNALLAGSSSSSSLPASVRSAPPRVNIVSPDAPSMSIAGSVVHVEEAKDEENDDDGGVPQQPQTHYLYHYWSTRPFAIDGDPSDGQIIRGTPFPIPATTLPHTTNDVAAAGAGSLSRRRQQEHAQGSVTRLRALALPPSPPTLADPTSVGAELLSPFSDGASSSSSAASLFSDATSPFGERTGVVADGGDYFGSPSVPVRPQVHTNSRTSGGHPSSFAQAEARSTAVDEEVRERARMVVGYWASQSRAARAQRGPAVVPVHHHEDDADVAGVKMAHEDDADDADLDHSSPPHPQPAQTALRARSPSPTPSAAYRVPTAEDTVSILGAVPGESDEDRRRRATEAVRRLAEESRASRARVEAH